MHSSRDITLELGSLLRTAKNLAECHSLLSDRRDADIAAHVEPAWSEAHARMRRIALRSEAGNAALRLMPDGTPRARPPPMMATSKAMLFPPASLRHAAAGQIPRPDPVAPMPKPVGYHGKEKKNQGTEKP